MKALQVKKTTSVVSYRKDVMTLLQETNVFLCCLLGFCQSSSQRTIKVNNLVYFLLSWRVCLDNAWVFIFIFVVVVHAFQGQDLVQLEEDYGVKASGPKSEDRGQERYIIKCCLLHLYCLFCLFVHFFVTMWWGACGGCVID